MWRWGYMCVYRVSQKKVTNRIRQKRFNLLSLLPGDMALVDFRSNGATMLFVCLHVIISVNSFFWTPCILDMQEDGIRNIRRYSTTHWTKRRSTSQRLTIQVSTMVDHSGVLLGAFYPSSLASPLPCSSRYHLSSPSSPQPYWSSSGVWNPHRSHCQHDQLCAGQGLRQRPP